VKGVFSKAEKMARNTTMYHVQLKRLEKETRGSLLADTASIIPYIPTKPLFVYKNIKVDQAAKFSAL
jgi:hypothetical protein